MRKPAYNLILTAVAFMALLLSGCIHEYPYPVNIQKPDAGQNPETMEASLEIYYNLSWDNLLHHIDFETKSTATRVRGERPHRFLI